MNDVLAYFLTWTTYGAWLPGDERGWVEKGKPGIQTANPLRVQTAQELMAEEPVILTAEQRVIVDEVLVQHCQIRKWILHARNVRTNHVHIVVTALVEPEKVREQFKAWGSRRLSEHAGLVGRRKNGQKRWWTEGGDIEWIYEDQHLENAVRYVAELQ